MNGAMSDEEMVEVGEYVHWRTLPDGFQIGIRKMMGRNWRLHFGLDRTGPWSNYCYHDEQSAVDAMNAFDPERDQEPDGWIKHVDSNRCRPDGTAASESIGWPLPEFR